LLRGLWKSKFRNELLAKSSCEDVHEIDYEALKVDRIFVVAQRIT
jgi:hypothetical protein